jgi:hypothetical protein
MKGVLRVISGKGFLLWLILGWILFYVTFAIWSKEAFASFVGWLGSNPLVQIPYVLFLISGVLNLVRASRETIKRGVVRFAMWVLLPAGVLVFLTGFFLSANLRHHEWILAGEGDTLRPRWQEFPYVLSEIEPPLKDELFAVEGESVFKYEPKVTVSADGESFIVGVYPPTMIRGTYYHILDFGLAPGIRLKKGNEVLHERYVLVKILPPGSEDVFEVPPYTFFIRIAPEKTVRKGITKAKLYSLVSPVYEVRVVRGDEVVFEGSSRDGVLFESRELSFFEPAYWVRLEVVKDPAVYLLIAGVAVTGAGVLSMGLLVLFNISSQRRRGQG